jgi:hypothetical protein
MGAAMDEAVRAFRRDVEERTFPGPEHAYTISEEEWREFSREINGTDRRPISFIRRG